MRNLIAILAAAALLGPGSAMAASGAATLRGVAYVCGSDSVLPGAELRLIHQEDGRTISLRADANGRFVRVGLDPGTYTIVLMPLPENGWAPYFVASRVARFEADDVVDMRIGSRPVPRIIARARPPRCRRPPDDEDRSALHPAGRLSIARDLRSAVRRRSRAQHGPLHPSLIDIYVGIVNPAARSIAARSPVVA